MNTSYAFPMISPTFQKIAIFFGLVEDQAAERERATEIQRKEDEKLLADQADELAHEQERLQKEATEVQAEKDRLQVEVDEKERRAEVAQAEADKLA